MKQFSFILITLFFFNCSEHDEKLDQIKNVSYLDNIGQMHNELITNYLEKSGNIEFSNTQTLVRDFYDFSIENNPELENYSKYYNRQLNRFNQRLKITDIYNNFETELDELLVNGELSSYLHSQLLKIVKNPSLENAQNIINEMQAKPNLESNEKNALLAFAKILESSKTLWQEDSSRVRGGDCGGLDSGEMAIIGDAIGGAMWWWTGPAAALISGGYSLALYNSGCPTE